MAAILAPPEIAVQRWLTDDKTRRLLTHDIICLHTMVGTLAGSWAWSNRDGGTYWHFGVAGNGTAWQIWDLQFRSAANLNGNWHVIPIETADMNEGIWPNTWTNPLWTPAQMLKLAQLVAWLCKRFNIPPVLIPDTRPGHRGIAYHRMGINPWRVDGGELWSLHDGKTCPADRVKQIATLINMVRAILNPTQGDWLDMASLAEVSKLLDAKFKEFVQGNVAPAGVRVVKEGWVPEEPVYVSDLQSYIFQIERGGDYDTLLMNLKKLTGENPNAIRLPQPVIDEMLKQFPSVKTLA